MADIKTEVEQLRGDIALMHQIVHGDETVEVTTESGPQPSVRKAVADAETTAQAQVNISTEAAAQHASNAADSEQVSGERADAAEQSKVAAIEAETGAKTAESGAGVSAAAAKSDADRSLAERQQITNELTLAQQARDDAQTAQAAASAIAYGDMDWVVPAVTKLLAGYTDIIATAMSDDTWAANAYKWGGPSRVFAAARTNRVTLYDATKPSMPIWREYQTGGTSGSMTGHVLAPNASITCIELCGDALVVGKNESTGNWYSGLFVLSHGENCAYRWKYGSGSKYNGTLDQAADDLGFSQISSLGLYDMGGSDEQHVNAVAALIDDDAPCSPVSGLPMPRIGVATDGGVAELIPDGSGYWALKRASYAYGSIQTVHYEAGRLMAARAWDALVWDMSGFADGGTLTTGNAISRSGVDSGLQNAVRPAVNISGGTLVSAGNLYGRIGVDELAIMHANPSDRTAGMVAHAGSDYATGYMVGDIQFAGLCDGEEGVVTELIETADWSVDLDGWVAQSENAVPAVNGDGSITLTYPGDILNRGFSKGGTLNEECPVLAVFEAKSPELLRLIGHLSGVTLQLTADWVEYELPLPESLNLYPHGDDVTANPGATISLRNFRIKRLTEDRSGNGNYAKIHGTLSRSKLPGSDVALWTGFSSGVNALEVLNSQGWFPHDKDWCFTIATNANGDILMGQVGIDAAWNTYDRTGFRISVSGPSGSKAMYIKKFPGELSGSEGRDITFSDWGENNDWKILTVVKDGAGARLYQNGVNVASDDAGWDLDAGVAYGNFSISAMSGDQAAFLTYSESIPSDDQIRSMHRAIEMMLEKPSILPVTVRDVAHDAVRDQHWVACSDDKLYRFDGPVIVESVAVDPLIGQIDALSVHDGEAFVGGSAGAWAYQPEKNLRAPVIKRGKNVRPFELGEGNSAETDFWLPYGWKAERAYVDGSKKRKGAQDDWVPLFNGYKHGIRFAVAPGVFDIDCDAVEV